MDETQLKAAAAGFIQALFENDKVRDAWVTCKNNKWAGLGELIKTTVGLAQAPSDDEIAAMHDYAADEYFCATPGDVEEKDDRVEAAYLFNGVHQPPPPTN